MKTGDRVQHGEKTYIIGEQLGSGGFGTVFSAERIEPGHEEVVVKVPHPHLLADPIWSKKFQREASILANISHPNVVRVVAFWKLKDSNEVAIVQEKVIGAQPLDVFVRENRSKVASLLLQTLYGLRACHEGKESRAVHRDLSPANILVNASGVVKIIDFGLAKPDPRTPSKILTRFGESFGTPGAMAPEQYSAAKDVDCRADLYSLGRSFTASIQDRMLEHADPHALPEPWRSICVRLTRHDPTERYQSATEAINESVGLFADHQVPIDQKALHLKEHKDHRDSSSRLLDALVADFIRAADIPLSELDFLAEILSLSSDGFGLSSANELLDKLEQSTAFLDFDEMHASYEDCDPLGRLCRCILPRLSHDRKMRCFRRLCRTAVQWHRFSVMGDVRNAYREEDNRETLSEFAKILAAEDPGADIWSFGILPERAKASGQSAGDVELLW